MPEATTTLDALERLAFSLVSLTAKAIAERGGPGQLRFLHWRAIVALGESAAPIRVSDLAARIFSSGPSASRIATRLARQGMVQLEPDARDGRVVRLRLTERGSQVRSDVIRRRRELIRELIGEAADGSATDRELAIVEALERAT
jgi:DNA-binding MarR family transcriptional regulator